MRQLLLFVLLLITAPDLSAQAMDSLRLRPGDPVRFPGPLPGQATLVDGTVVSVLPHAFAFRLQSDSSRLYTRTYETLSTIDVGYHDAGQSAFSGGLLGLFVGSALGIVTGPFFASNLSLDTGTAVMMFAAGGGLLGGGAGAAVGALTAPLRWHRYVFEPVPGSRPAACPTMPSSC